VGIWTGLSWPRIETARKHVRKARDFNNIETRYVKFFFLQGKAPKKIHAFLTETLACFLPCRAKDLSVLLYKRFRLLGSDTFHAVVYRGGFWGFKTSPPKFSRPSKMVPNSTRL